MARRPRRTSRTSPSRSQDLPVGPVAVDSGTVELVRHRSEPGRITLMVNGVPSSHVEIGEPTWLAFEYMQQMAAVLDTLLPGAVRAVHLGAGACSLPHRLAATRPGSRQIAVDVDARLLELVRQWFALPRSPELRLRAGDALAVLRTLPDASADVVVRDAFAGDRTPDHLVDTTFVAQVARVLRPGGIYLANCADRPPLTLVRSEVATLRTVLTDVHLVAEPGQLKGRRYGNLVLVGRAPGPAQDRTDTAGLARALRSLPIPATLLRGSELDAFVAGAPVLTPKAAPQRDATSGQTGRADLREDGPSPPGDPSGPA